MFSAILVSFLRSNSFSPSIVHKDAIFLVDHELYEQKLRH